MESLYRSYRPQTFADVVGQSHVVTTLERAVSEGRTAQAYLFCGPRGTGKTTMARLLAKALLCDGGPAALPDGTCEQCRLIAAGEHPDVYELDAASRTGVDNVREEIIASVAFAPVMGRAKVYIIDEVHMLTTAAFNALLKTLEEPPAHVTFVLCTTEPTRVPETILSRVQRFDFHAIGMDELIDRLAYVCSHEGIVAEPAALELVARHARGGLRDALSSLEQLAVFGGGKVSLQATEALLGGADGNELSALTHSLATRDIAVLFSQVATASDSGRDLLVLTRELAAHLRDVYVVAALAGEDALQAAANVHGTLGASAEGKQSSLEEAVQHIVERVPVAALATTGNVSAIAVEAAAFGSADRIARALAVLADVSAEMRTAPNQRLILEIALTRIARPESDLTLEALADRITTLESRFATLAIPHTATTSPRTADPVSDTHFAVQPNESVEFDAGIDDEDSMYAADEYPVEADVSTAYSGGGEGLPSAPPTAPSFSSEYAADMASEPAATTAMNQASSGSELASPNTPSPAESLVSAELQRRWRQVVDELITAAPARGSLLAASTLERDDGQTLLVTLPKGSTFAAKMLTRVDVQATVTPVVERVFGARRVIYAEASLAAADIARADRTAVSSQSAPATPPAPTVSDATPDVAYSPVNVREADFSTSVDTAVPKSSDGGLESFSEETDASYTAGASPAPPLSSQNNQVAAFPEVPTPVSAEVMTANSSPQPAPVHPLPWDTAAAESSEAVGDVEPPTASTALPHKSSVSDVSSSTELEPSEPDMTHASQSADISTSEVAGNSPVFPAPAGKTSSSDEEIAPFETDTPSAEQAAVLSLLTGVFGEGVTLHQ